MTMPWDAEALWLKSRMFIHRAMDSDREFEEQAFWASVALELLGKAALVRISPMLIAHPDDDGRSLLMASGAIDYVGTFSSVQAKAVWSRCARAFRPFNEDEAKKIAAGRNEYIHSAGVGFDAIPQDLWWPRYWAQAFILLEHLDQGVADFVGAARSSQVERHLAANKQYLERRLATLVARAKSRLSRHRLGSMSSRLEAEWNAFSPTYYQYNELRECPACGSEGHIGGEEINESHAAYETQYFGNPEDPFQYDELRSVTLDIIPTEFRCSTCHLILDEPELLERAGLHELFQVEGDPEDYYDGPEYENE